MIGSLRSAWKALPLPQIARRAISPTLWSGLDRFFEMRMRRHPHAVLPGAAKVAGFFSESHGIAASAHRCADALEALDVAVERVDLGAPTHAALLRRPAVRYAPGGAWIFHVNPPELVVALAAVGPETLKQCFLAGYWAWELPQAPASWLRRKALVDEVWAPSTFTARALAKGHQTPVRVVPHPLTQRPAQDRAALRAQLSLPGDKFLVTTLFDYRSSIARKNPLGAIAAFSQAFGDDPSALLVVKAQHGDLAPAQRTKLATAALAANIRVIDEPWPLAHAEALIGASDALLSLHRAEGFGLTAAEAMAIGTPVIATNWSGNVDFMCGYEALVDARLEAVEDAQRIYAGQNWAEPNIAQAAALLRRLRADKEFGPTLAAHGRALVAERLGLQSYRASLGPAFWAAVTR